MRQSAQHGFLFHSLSQNPQCGGYHQDRILFNSKAPNQGPVFYSVRSNDDLYIINIGAAHGITEKAEFTVYQDPDWPPKTSPLGVIVALKTTAFSTNLDVPSGDSQFALARPAFALQTRAGTNEDLRLHVAMDERLTCIFEALAREMQCSGPDHRSILLVSKDQACWILRSRMITSFSIS
jgi:hypothetical protein